MKQIKLNDINVTSYSFEIWFMLSGWNDLPTISSDRAISMTSDSIYYKIDMFYDVILDMIVKYHNFRYISHPRPMHLRDSLDVDVCKGYILRLILSYWFGLNNIRLPESINEVIDTGVVPADIRDVALMMNCSDSSCAADNYKLIVDTIIKYNCNSNKLCSIGDIEIPIDKYNMLHANLYDQTKASKIPHGGICP